MTGLESTRDVLATVASYCGITVSLRTIQDWHDIIGPIPPELAKAAVRQWYATNRGYIQPYDLASEAAKLAGADVPDSVTRRRLEGRQLEWHGQGLGEPMRLTTAIEANDEGQEDEEE